MSKKLLILIDAYNFLFRAFYAMPPLTNNKGIPVGAVYGFINMILKYIINPPDYMVIACDTGTKTFRDIIYPEYKIHRGEAPDELCIQFPLLKESLDAFDLVNISKNGYEADDIIATLATKFASPELQVNILSSDKDLIQLMDDNIKIFDPMKNKFTSEDDVIKKFGVKHTDILDFLSLTGDSADNIPGVYGIGPITAAKLINEFKTLDNLLANLDSLKKSKMKENLVNFKDNAIISKQLITLDKTVELEKDLEDLKVKPLNEEKVLNFLEENGFKNISERIIKHFGMKARPNVDSYNIAQHSNHPTHNINAAEESEPKEGIVYVEQDGEDIIIKGKDISFRFKVSEITAEIKKLLADESIIKVTNVDNNFFHKVTINSMHCIKVMRHTLNSSLQSETTKYHYLMQELFEQKLLVVYFRIEKPIIPIVIAMEKKGVKIDRSILDSLSIELENELKIIETEIFSLANCSFNIASPKQMAEVLFETMKIPYPTKSKKMNTAANTLEELENAGNAIAGKILKWRELSKLKTTYTDSLVKHISSITDRVHTTYSSIGTNTGRLSSSNPNLQNIPRDKRIKRAFVAKEGHYLISADYSQIELRIIAHLANIKNFKKILLEGGDIHSFTASQMFSNQDITAELRQKAKAINFGIIYGITPFGLAKQLKISTTEAKTYIDSYFEQYPEIKDYMESTKKFARDNGYVLTDFGRKCEIKDINSTNYILRGIAERSAINAPIQGTAADIIKKAMIKIADSELADYMIMQVHDEIILEVPKGTELFIKKILTSALHVPYGVTLDFELKIGENLAYMDSCI